MKMKMFSIYDTVACVFNKPFTDINDASATRAFKESLKENPHSTDYELYRIGEYDDSNGTIVPLSPVKLSSGFEQAAVEAAEIKAV